MKITNGKDIFEVTRGAFESIYKRLGFVPFEETDGSPQTADGSSQTPDDDTLFLENVELKPIAQWSNDELRRYAQLKGIPIPANAKQLRAAVQAELKAAGGREQEAAEG